MNPSTTGARVLLDELVRLGLREVVLCPGSRSAPLAYAAHDLEVDGRIRLHVRVDERSAAFPALGPAKTSRRPAAVITTSGTAVANLHPAVLEAHHGAVPLLLLTADRPPELRGIGANPGDRPNRRLRRARPPRPRARDPRRPVAAGTGVAHGRGPGRRRGHRSARRDRVRPVRCTSTCPTATRSPRAAATSRRAAASPTPCSVDPTALRGSPCPSRPPGLPPRSPGRPPSSPTTPTPSSSSASCRLRSTAPPRSPGATHHGAPVIAEPGPGGSPLVLPHGDRILAATHWVGEHLPSRVVVVGRPTPGRAVPALTRTPGLRVEVVTPGEPGAAGWADATHTAAAVHPFAALEVQGEGREATPFARTRLTAGERVAAALAPDARADADLDGPVTARVVHDALPRGQRPLPRQQQRRPRHRARHGARA
uniref:Uncharacterized protein n=1 Tax=Janibacter limosus TaxID=53458 RepID=A0AC61U5K4_9MICO|nr:thiamine pyrophosphate-binding protein [Janibacter limosus]